jgi:hypothetical protein
MHPGPMIRGLEITSEVADGPQSVIEKQVQNGVAIRMALIQRALAHEQPPKSLRAAPKPKLKRPSTPSRKRGGS